MRFEPNTLLAITTGCAMGMLIGSASIFGEEGLLLKYVLTTILVVACYVPLNGWMLKRMGRPALPLIRLDSPHSAMWANIYPGLIGILAFVPLIFAGKDFGLMVVIAAVWFAITVGSALNARKAS